MPVEPIRVAVWSPCWSQVGGTETFHRDFFRAMVEDDGLEPRIEPIGIGTIKAPHDSIFDLIPDRCQVEWGLNALYKVAKDADVIVQWGFNKLACKLPRSEAYPWFVTTIHGSTNSGWTMEIAYACGPHTDHYACVSEAAAGCVPQGKPYTVIPNAAPDIRLDEPVVRPNHEDDERFVFIHPGRLVQDKGLDAIVQLARSGELLNLPKKCEIVCVGIGPYDRKIAFASKETNAKYGRPLIRLEPPRKDWWTIPHDAMILPSRHEGFGYVTVESWIVGTPVISTNDGIAKSYPNAFHPIYSMPCQHVTPKELYDAMSSFLDLDHQRRNIMALDGFTIATNDLSFESFKSSWRKLVRDLGKKRKR